MPEGISLSSVLIIGFSWANCGIVAPGKSLSIEAKVLRLSGSFTCFWGTLGNFGELIVLVFGFNF